MLLKAFKRSKRSRSPDVSRKEPPSLVVGFELSRLSVLRAFSFLRFFLLLLLRRRRLVCGGGLQKLRGSSVYTSVLLEIAHEEQKRTRVFVSDSGTCLSFAAPIHLFVSLGLSVCVGSAYPLSSDRLPRRISVCGPLSWRAPPAQRSFRAMPCPSCNLRLSSRKRTCVVCRVSVENKDLAGGLQCLLLALFGAICPEPSHKKPPGERVLWCVVVKKEESLVQVNKGAGVQIRSTMQEHSDKSQVSRQWLKKSLTSLAPSSFSSSSFICVCVGSAC